MKLHNACFGAFVNGVCPVVGRSERNFFTDKFMRGMPQVDKWLEQLLVAAKEAGYTDNTIPYECFEAKERYYRPEHPKRVAEEEKERQVYNDLLLNRFKTEVDFSVPEAFVVEGNAEGYFYVF